MSKNYCIFSAQYLPHMGGVERYTYYLAKELIACGHSVTVVTSLMDGLQVREQTDGIEIFRLPGFNLMNGRLPVLKYSKELKKTEKILKERDFDFVVINTRFYLMSLYASRFAYKNNIKCAVVEHGTSHLTFNNALLDIFEKIYEHGITAFLKHYCKSYYGVSKACCDWSRHFGIDSKGVLYNSIDVNEIEQLVNNPIEDYRKKYNAENNIVITFTGRMIKEKGIYELISAVSNLKADRKITLFMAGDGPELANIERMKKSKDSGAEVITLGRIDFQHIAALLKASDIYCLPSVSEGFPTSVLEAAAAGCFVITTYNGGARELIVDGDSGIIIPDNSVANVTGALQRAVSDEEFRKYASMRAYEAVNDKFTWRSTAEKLISIS